MVVVLLLVALLSGQALPSLPTLALDSYPPAAREALSRAHKQATTRAKDPDAVGDLGRWLHAWELWDAAHQTYQRAQSLAATRFDWVYLDAVVLQRLARHDEAAALLRRAVALNGDYLPARLKLAEAVFESGDLLESRKLFDALLKEPAAQPAAHVGLGRIAAQEGKPQAAVEHFERAVAAFPELGAAYYGLARAYRALGRSEEAARALEQHTRHGARWPRLDDPVFESVTALREDPRAVLKRGVRFAETGEIDKAIADHEAALLADPSLVNAHANLLSLYGRVKNFAKAEQHYRAAIAAGFAPADLHYDYGVIMAMQENWTAAEESYRRAIAANPLHVQAHNNLGGLLERRDVEAAAAEYRLAIAAQPSFRLARFNLGRMLLALNKAEEARGEFEKLRQPRDAETPRYLFALATVHVRSGRREEGIKLATEAQLLAKEYGQAELAAAIARELAVLK
jgi:tetratricopeptide (TPR) repeat protein